MKFKLTKNKIVGLLAIVVILVVAFWAGGDTSRSQSNKTPDEEVVTKTDTLGKETVEESEEKSEEKEDEVEDDETETVDLDEENDDELKIAEDADTEEDTQETDKSIEVTSSKEEKSKTNDKNNRSSTTNQQTSGTNTKSTSKTNSKTEAKQKPTEKTRTEKDEYQTDPVPKGKPEPVEPEETVVKDVQSTATLSVRADTALQNLDLLDPAIAKLIPKDGIIFSARKVTFKEGESVFDVLQREMRNAGIHMESSFTPLYNSAYVEGINNLYEFDVGGLSGWMYRVNGWFPNYGASRYRLKNGDVIEWLYTCDLGADIGGGNYYGEQ